MSNVSTYAQGLLQSALGDWLDELVRVQRTLRRQPELMTTLSDPNAAPSERESAARRLVSADAPAPVANFVRLLVQQGDITLLDEILRMVRGMVPALDDGGGVLVTSAHALSDTEKETLESRLRASHGEETRISYELDPELLGGLRIRIGDRIIDHSVAARLDALRERLVR